MLIAHTTSTASAVRIAQEGFRVSIHANAQDSGANFWSKLQEDRYYAQRGCTLWFEWEGPPVVVNDDVRTDDLIAGTLFQFPNWRSVLFPGTINGLRFLRGQINDGEDGFNDAPNEQVQISTKVREAARLIFEKYARHEVPINSVY